MESSKSSYTAGELIRFTLRNATRDTILVDGCALALLHGSAGNLEQVGNRDCAAIGPIRQMRPGDRATDSIASGSDFPRGLYRGEIVIIESLDPRRVTVKHSNTFTLQ